MTKPKETSCSNCGAINRASRKTCSSCYSSIMRTKTFKERVNKITSSDWGEMTKKHRNGARVVASAHVTVSKLHALGYNPILFIGKRRVGASSVNAELVTFMCPGGAGPAKVFLEKMTKAYEYLLKNSQPSEPSTSQTPEPSTSLPDSEGTFTLTLIPVPVEASSSSLNGSQSEAAGSTSGSGPDPGESPTRRCHSPTELVEIEEAEELFSQSEAAGSTSGSGPDPGESPTHRCHSPTELEETEEAEECSNKLALEGVVVQRAECRTAISEKFMKLKKLMVEHPSKPFRLSQQLDKAVTSNYKPVSNHANNLECDKEKKEGKRKRADKQQVQDMLFSAFEKHQFYSIKDLVDITKQPVIYLKEILRDIGIYNVKGTHKNTWELRREYRHYQGEEEKAE